MREKDLNILKYSYLILILSFYFFGFFQRENIAGGAEQDFLKFTWPVINSFKENFFYTLENYGSFGEGSFPLFHILNAYLNPFTFNEIYFQGSITLISLLNIVFFAKIIKKRLRISQIDSIIFSSVLLFLPFFRSSAYWGITENLGWLFLILSINFYLDYESKDSKKRTLFHIFLICLFSSLALYTRPYLVFFPIFIMLTFLFKRDYFFILRAGLFYFLFSLPVFYLLYLWGGIFYELGSNNTSLVADYHNPKFILKNLVIFSSILLFYLTPFKLSEWIKSSPSVDTKQLLIFIIIFGFLILLNYYHIFDYLESTTLGGGVILKINQIFFDNFILFLFISTIGFLLIYDYFFISKKNFILLISLIIFCFPKHIFQEYYEPLVIIIALTLIDLDKIKFQTLKENRTLLLFIIYFFSYYCGSFLYRSF